MTWGAVAGAAIGAVGSIIGSRSSSRAQTESSDAAIAEQRAARIQARDDLSPFREAGANTLGTLQEFVQTGPDAEFERTEGFRDIENSAAAGGRLRSGGTLRALTSFNSGLNARNRQQRFNELFNLSTLGANAASGQATATLNTASNISDLTVGRGDAIAAGRVGTANAVGSGISDIARIIASRRKG